MFQKTRGLRTNLLKRLTLLLGLALCGCEQSIPPEPKAGEWVQYEPPNRGAPGETSDLGSRPLCRRAATPFTSISPSTNWGETLESHPTFWLYLPYQASSVRLILRDEPTQEELYRTTFAVSGRDGVARFRLPETAPPLEVDRLYNWQFDFICDSENRSRFRVRGLVVRRALSEELQTQLREAAAQERVALLAEQGFWYDALTGLAELRLTAPDPILDAGWAVLLGHASVGLEDLAEKPLLDCCTEEGEP
ncbi:DUF928 domain-containing protein [Pseudanabaena sp. FACHB-2040]|uniref:DUF928 domain-containing protein n=1 Tax=Pseudanabaena sp. FACHB-2040 TaxID=2692859 RepID=UPI00168983EC|nr:DUF928 domain-containing protein [Pseudanabaena sp. FACHB-2040]MBD2259389.1 DUF928 domain-containing protein [Pseudanabaena sp. FACHB-2040]